MKSRPWMNRWACVVFTCGLTVSVQARKEELTLLLVPREETATKLGLDLAKQYPVLLGTYRIAPSGAISLHGWTGKKWVNITLADYTAGNFFEQGPHSTLIVEKVGVSVPKSLIPPLEWCNNVFKITTTQVRPLIHLTGQYFDFRYNDWKWFAKHYGMEIDAINPEGLNLAWYHKRLDEHLKSSGQKGSNDLQYWVSLRQTLVPAEPPRATELEEEDPFTNAVPAAVVFGAGDVPAELEKKDDASDEPSPEKEVGGAE